MSRKRTGTSWPLSVVLAASALVPAAAVTVTACGGGGGSPAQAAPAPAPVGPPGRQVYAQSCARCHGYDGAPLRSGTPALVTAKIAGQGDQALGILIRSGKGQMPAFGALTDAQVADLITYLRSL